MKILFRNIHLYLGLAAGIVITIICATGAILVFEKEWQSTIYPERYTVSPSPEKIVLKKTTSTFEEKLPGSSIASIKIFNDPSRSLEVTYAEKKTEAKSKNKKEDGKEKKNEAGKGPGRLQAFMNPHTGEMIALYNHRNTFFFTVFSLHRWLLAGDTGKLITGISTLIFLFILLTGIILWWPKTKAKLKQHLTLKWGASWKRINHDLHVVLGFYASIFLFAFAFTGLAWSFEWFNNGIYWITGTENKRQEPPSSIISGDTTIVSFDEVYASLRQLAPHAEYYNINKAKDSLSTINVTLLNEDAPHESATDQYYFDQYTGRLSGTALFKDRNTGQTVRSYFYPIHVGSIGGLTGRIIAFISCILGVMFPTTGIILWINRLRKNRKKKIKKKKADYVQGPTRSTSNKKIKNAAAEKNLTA